MKIAILLGFILTFIIRIRAAPSADGSELGPPMPPTKPEGLTSTLPLQGLDLF
jgi:hypothetical protein